MNSQQFCRSLKERPHTCVIRVLFKTGGVPGDDTESYAEQKSIFPLSEPFVSRGLKVMIEEASAGTGK